MFQTWQIQSVLKIQTVALINHRLKLIDYRVLYFCESIMTK